MLLKCEEGGGVPIHGSVTKSWCQTAFYCSLNILKVTSYIECAKCIFRPFLLHSLVQNLPHVWKCKIPGVDSFTNCFHFIVSCTYWVWPTVQRLPNEISLYFTSLAWFVYNPSCRLPYKLLFHCSPYILSLTNSVVAAKRIFSIFHFGRLVRTLHQVGWCIIPSIDYLPNCAPQRPYPILAAQR